MTGDENYSCGGDSIYSESYENWYEGRVVYSGVRFYFHMLGSDSEPELLSDDRIWEEEGWNDGMFPYYQGFGY